MTEPLIFLPAYQARRLVEIKRDFTKRFDEAENQQQLRAVRDDYLLALAKIGIGPDDMEDHSVVVPPAANATPCPAPIPVTRKPRRGGVLLAIRSALSYFARRVYHPRNSG